MFKTCQFELLSKCITHMKHINALSHFLLKHIHKYTTNIKYIFLLFHTCYKNWFKTKLIHPEIIRDNSKEPGFLGCTPVIHSLIT